MIKKDLVGSDTLAWPVYNDPDRPFIIRTDASHAGLGAIRLQNDENGVQRPITYASRSLSADEIKWDTRE